MVAGFGFFGGGPSLALSTLRIDKSRLETHFRPRFPRSVHRVNFGLARFAVKAQHFLFPALGDLRLGYSFYAQVVCVKVLFRLHGSTDNCGDWGYGPGEEERFSS